VRLPVRTRTACAKTPSEYTTADGVFRSEFRRRPTDTPRELIARRSQEEKNNKKYKINIYNIL